MSNLIDLNNSNTSYYGPILDLTSLSRGYNCIGKYQTPENEDYLRKMEINIIYYIDGADITFTYHVYGMDYINISYFNYDFTTDFCYSGVLDSVTVNNKDCYCNTIRPKCPMCYKYFSKQHTLKEIMSITDLLLDYMFLGNTGKVSKKWLDDEEYLEKYVLQHKKLEDLEKDFE